jgi:alkylated DNA repair dioxygenase AlkB
VISPFFFPGWCTYADEVLAALREVFTYSEGEPDRATGWLFLPPEGRNWPGPFAALGPQLLGELQDKTGTAFTAACFQAYLNGSGCGWHHDRNWDAQAILSLGVTRSFALRRDGTREMTVPLQHGDLFVMPSGFQHEWEHNVPTEDVEGERCSLVFRSPNQEQ